MKKKRFVALLMTMAMLVSMLSGCSFGSSAKKVTQIYFLSCKPEVKSVWEEVSAAYEKETGVKLKVLTAADGNHERTLKAELAKKDYPTMFQINGPVEYGKWKNYCMDLSDTKLYSWLLDKSMAVTGDNGKGAYGIPYVVEGYGIIYNNAIMEKYFALSDRTSQIKSMGEINNFAALKEVVEDMQAHKSELGIEGVFGSTSLSPGESWRWHTHLMNIPITYELQDKNASELDSIDFTYSDEFKNVFDLYVNNSCTPASELTDKGVEDSMQEFAKGKAAMIQNGNWGWTQIESTDGNVVKQEDAKYMPIYTGMDGEESQGLCIGTENYICINSQATDEEKQASIDFLEWLYSSKEGKKFVTEKFGFIPPFSTFKESEYPSNPLAVEVLEYMNDSSKKSVPWNFVTFPNQKFKDNMGSDLTLYVNGEMDWDTLVDTVKADWTNQKSSEEE